MFILLKNICYLVLLFQIRSVYSSDEVERTCSESNWAANCPASPDQQTEKYKNILIFKTHFNKVC